MHQTAACSSVGVGLAGVGVLGLVGVGATSVLGVVKASSLGIGGCVGVGAAVDGIWFKMRPRSARYHALSFSQTLWSMSAPPIKKAMSMFLFFAATMV